MIKIAIAGVGNCASSLIQGLEYYKNADQDKIPGIMFADIGDYYPRDIEVVAAYEVDKRKVGKPISQAIFEKPNVARIFCPEVKDTKSPNVQLGFQVDGISEHMKGDINSKDKFFVTKETETLAEAESRISNSLKSSGADILINYLPVGSNEGSAFYARCAIAAGVSFLNCIPALDINSNEWEYRFIDAGIPYIGSDMKSQFGASILSQILQELAFERGMEIDYHQQINVGGNTDFHNMMNSDRLRHKKVSKENVIRAQNDLRGIPVQEDALFAGPSTYIPYLKDNKIAYLNLHMRGFGDAEVTLDCKLSVQDSENSAGVVIDAIRFLKVAREMGVMGCLRGPSSFTQKSPPTQMDHQTSIRECEALAKRELTEITRKQTNAETAKAFALSEYESGRMNYLNLIKEK